ncbi:MAG TPA: anthranilate synthase component I family protein [Phycisphaerae bacterium]|nr:anthranilate synthase component I family protein [Phycisphaerae bacterium]HRY66956.1 anthranilate synthase component I family protein [Phycisphaerae bacterium]HSA27904.1 anthranilate synthase component I family protein [Phycisphaerae bacterium]
MRIRSVQAPVNPPVEAVLARVAARRQPVVLDSAGTRVREGRFTIAAFDPVMTVEWGSHGDDPFEALRRHLHGVSGGITWVGAAPTPGAMVFPCGWIGYLAYEAGRFIERLPAATKPDVGLPVARFALYDAAAIHDALLDEWTLVTADWDAGLGPNAMPWQARQERWSALLSEAALPSPLPPRASSPPPDHNLSRGAYERMVRRALEYIAAGDVFQVNLARRETYPLREPPVTTYLRLRRANPGAYSAFLSWSRVSAAYSGAAEGSDAVAILSSSPELFLQLRNRSVLTRPIKGTRPRSIDPAVDASLKAELAVSDKDRAELAMIVDLERNDLGRVCRYGSVRVLEASASPAQPYVLETHPTVHHLVADVVGELADGRDAIDLLRACFPGGSITGAPKVRAMQIIDELEPSERSVYTGSIGCFGLDGSMTMNIAIRTLLVVDNRVHLYVGGGIVADSRPDDEYRETQAKALGMARALGVTADEAGAEFVAEPAVSSQAGS